MRYLVMTIMLLSGCASIPPSTSPTKPYASLDGKPVLFVADPQIHNVFGRELKQMSEISNLVSKVAIRPPELNILAPKILQHLVAQGIKAAPPKAIIVLGDVTNIACSGEYELFARSMDVVRPKNIPLLMAHGNHDSYLMGTVNSYIPGKGAKWPVGEMDKEDQPVDLGWWGKSSEISSSNQRNWRDGCFKPQTENANESSPMNKSRWMAKYLSSLEKDGLSKIKSEDDESISKAGGKKIDYTFKPNSLLAAYKYSASGVWYAPHFGKTPTSEKFDVQRVSKSYIVQSVDFDDSRVVIIDTSVCKNARGGLLAFSQTNAGTRACIGMDQFRDIKNYVDTSSPDLRLVIAGHFPLKDLTSNERHELFSILNKRKGWIYMSAHSHDPVSQRKWENGLEINVGSTTDWPMEVNSVWLGVKNEPNVVTTTNCVPESFKFNLPANKASEVCRHLPTAKYLADLTKQGITEIESKDYLSEYSKCSVNKYEDWVFYGNELTHHMDVIYEAFDKDAVYRDLVLKISGAASRSEFHQLHLLGIIP